MTTIWPNIKNMIISWLFLRLSEKSVASLFFKDLEEFNILNMWNCANMKSIPDHTDALTEFRDAAHTGSQQGLLQRPQFQLGIGILSAVHRCLLILCVGTEMRRERQNTWENRESAMINMGFITSATIHPHCFHRSPWTFAGGSITLLYVIIPCNM